MKPSGGVWLVTVGALYLELLVIDMLAGEPVPSEIVQLAWVLIMSMPLYIPPLGRFFDIKSIWES